MQRHRACSAYHRPRKSSAFTCLVRAGTIVPSALPLRERAAVRGIAVSPIGDQLPVALDADLHTLRSVRDGLLVGL